MTNSNERKTRLLRCLIAALIVMFVCLLVGVQTGGTMLASVVGGILQLPIGAVAAATQWLKV